MLGISENAHGLLHRLGRWKPWFFALLLSVGLTLILSRDYFRADQVNAVLNSPSPERIEAPYDLEYISEYRTQEMQDEAARSVTDVYTELDRSIGELSVSNGKKLMAFIRTVRADPTATIEWKADALKKTDIVNVSAATADKLLSIDDAAIETIDGDIERMINTLMLNQIRESELSQVLSVVQRQIRFNTPKDQEEILLDIVPQLIAANTFFDPIKTEELRAAAVTEIDPVNVSVQQGEVILQEGQRVTDLSLEMLQSYNLLQREANLWDIGRNTIVAVLSTFIIGLYVTRFQRPEYHRGRYLTLYTLFFLGFTLTAQYMFNGTVYAYLFPAAAFAMLISVIFDMRFAVLTVVVLAGLVGYIADNSLQMTYYTLIGSIIAIFTLGDALRISSFFRAGLLAGIGNILVLSIFVFNESVQPLELLQLGALALGSGLLAASLAIGAFFIASSVFRITTLLQLQELSRFDNPVLQELLQHAPGTYHHSIMVANLAEQAADRLPDTSSLLARVGAFYHDIGKLANAPYFSENQEGEESPHKQLHPQQSAEIIIAHVTDGLKLAKKHHLPERIQDFIREHHGDQTLTYFYQKACEIEGVEDGDVTVVDPLKFKYPGPAPRSRETGIVLLADAVEATSKAVQPNNEAAIIKLVRKITDDMIAADQLDQSGLTLGDIHSIRESFTETLKGRYHVRVKYAGNDDLIAANTPEPIVEGEIVPEHQLPADRTIAATVQRIEPNASSS